MGAGDRAGVAVETYGEVITGGLWRVRYPQLSKGGARVGVLVGRNVLQ